MSTENKRYTKESLSGVEERMKALGLNKTAVLREISFALQIVNASDMLLQCSKTSLQSAILNIANIGLTLNPAAKEAYLVPRWNSKARANEATLQPSYIGIAKLVMETGGVSAITTNVVYERDFFTLDLADDIKPVTHKPHLVKAERGNILGVYSLATLKTGKKQAEWMDVDELHLIRERSESFKAYLKQKISTCIWITDESEMMRKTVIKRFVKYLPRTGAVAKLDEAIQLDNQEYQASFNQGMSIEDLLLSANISPEKSQQIYGSLNAGMTFAEASETIEFLKENQLEETPKFAGVKSAKGLGSSVMAAVNDPNT